jgi:hypothetical protein
VSVDAYKQASDRGNLCCACLYANVQGVHVSCVEEVRVHLQVRRCIG